METIFRTSPALDLGTIGGVPVVLTDAMQPWHSVDNPGAYPGDGIAKRVQDVLDAAAPGVWFVYRSGTTAAIVKLDYSPFSWVLTPAGAWYFGIAATGTAAALVGTVAWTPTHGLRISPPTRAWTRLKASDPGAGLVATVLDTQTYFTIRAWLTPTEHAAFAALADRPFVIGNPAPLPNDEINAIVPWSELATGGYLVLRCTDPRGLANPRLVGTTAALVEYEFETVLVRWS